MRSSDVVEIDVDPLGGRRGELPTESAAEAAQKYAISDPAAADAGEGGGDS